MVAAAWATTHAVEKASTRWLLLAGVFLGFGFLTKMLQAFLVVPGLAAAYLWAAPTTLWRRIRQLLAAGVAIVVSAGWWLLAVALWPVDSRPVHRRVDEQQPAGAGVRLQRPRPDLRRRGQRRGAPGRGDGRWLPRRRRGCRRWDAAGGGARWRRNGRLRRPGRAHAAVQQRDRRPDLLAAARRPDPAGRRAVVHPSRAADRPGSRRAAPVGRLDAGHRAGVLADGGHVPRLLHRRAGARHRRAGGRRRPRGVAGPRHLDRPWRPRRDHRGHRRLGLGAARSLDDVPALAALGRARGRRRRRDRAAGPGRMAGAGGHGRRRSGADRRAGGPDGVRGADRRDPAPGQHPDGGPEHRRRFRPGRADARARRRRRRTSETAPPPRTRRVSRTAPRVSRADPAGSAWAAPVASRSTRSSRTC